MFTLLLCWKLGASLCSRVRSKVFDLIDNRLSPEVYALSMEDFVSLAHEDGSQEARVDLIRVNDREVLVRARSLDCKSMRVLFFSPERIVLPINAPESETVFAMSRARTLGRFLQSEGISVCLYNEFGYIIGELLSVDDE